MRRRLPTSISSPRREWWSLLWVRRCSVSSLIRAVASAICTSAEPVSPSARPCLPISSLFFSLVRPMSRKRRAPGGSRPLEASTDDHRRYTLFRGFCPRLRGLELDVHLGAGQLHLPWLGVLAHDLALALGLAELAVGLLQGLARRLQGLAFQLRDD